MKVLMPNFDGLGLIPVVVKSITTGVILSVRYADRDCYLETLRTGNAVFYCSDGKKFNWRGQTVCHISTTFHREALIYLVREEKIYAGLTMVEVSATRSFETRSVFDLEYGRDPEWTVTEAEVLPRFTSSAK